MHSDSAAEHDRVWQYAPCIEYKMMSKSPGEQATSRIFVKTSMLRTVCWIARRWMDNEPGWWEGPSLNWSTLVTLNLVWDRVYVRSMNELLVLSMDCLMNQLILFAYSISTWKQEMQPPMIAWATLSLFRWLDRENQATRAARLEWNQGYNPSLSSKHPTSVRNREQLIEIPLVHEEIKRPTLREHGETLQLVTCVSTRSQGYCI